VANRVDQLSIRQLSSFSNLRVRGVRMTIKGKKGNRGKKGKNTIITTKNSQSMGVGVRGVRI
jgi:hypothetical protein